MHSCICSQKVVIVCYSMYVHWRIVTHLLLHDEVHYQLLCLANVQEDIVLLAPVLQAFYLFQIGPLIVLRDQAKSSQKGFLSLQTYIADLILSITCACGY